VTFQMIYGEERAISAKCETFGRRGPDEERCCQAGSGCRRKGIDLRARQSRFGERASNKVWKKGEMISRSNLRNDPAILRVNASLRRDPMRKHISATA
jgi:hypothetical protein